MSCPRCHGLLITNHGEQYCLNCGYRPVGPTIDGLPMRPRDEGAVIPCEICEARPSLPPKHLCSVCLGNRIREGSRR